MVTNSMHAYCLIVHNEPHLFRILISLLDDERNDIYVYLDKKTDRSLFESTSTKYSRIFFLNYTHYLSWGSPELLFAEQKSLMFAYSHGKYSYYHLISGTDLPIKSQDYIHDYLKNKNVEYVGVVKNDIQDSWVKIRTSVFYLFKNHLNKSRQCSRLGRCVFRIQDRFVTWQLFHPVFKRNFNMQLKMGPQWFSITSACVEYLLSMEKYFYRKYKYTIPDEIAIQSVIWNSPFRKNIYDLDNQYHSCLRKIDWKRGGPYVWKDEDYDELMNSDCLFARKFSSCNMTLVNRIAQTLKKSI